LHYGVSMVCLWVSFFLYEKFILSHKKRWLLLFWAVYIFSLLTLEISLVFPGLFVIVFMLLYEKHINRQTIVFHLKNIVLPMAAIIVLYFVATKILKGVFIGHYGAETHTLKLVSLRAAGTYMQYLAKLLGYAHFFTYKIREAVYELLKNGWVIATSASMFLAFSIYF